MGSSFWNSVIDNE